MINHTAINTHHNGFKSCRFYNKNRGFTLLEALIGFLILSIGMLGIASLQAVSLKAGKSAVYGSVAMMKVEELFESMRVNSTALVAYDAAVNSTSPGDAIGNNNCTGVNTCNPVQLAADDVFWWNQNLLAGLPAAASTTTAIVFTAPPPASNMATVVITVTWAERNKDDAADADGMQRAYTATANICMAVPC